MGLESYGRVKVVTLERLQPRPNGEMKHAFCTRLGGVSQGPFRSLNFDVRGGDSRENIAQNKIILGSALGLDHERFFLANQVHGDKILVLDDDPSEGQSQYQYLDYDGIITRRPGIAIGVLTADCLPIILYVPGNHAVGALHSGWRGTCLNIVRNAISKLREAYDVTPEDILVGLGPCIGPCCYDVDVKIVRSIKNSTNRWKDFLKPLKTNRYAFDLVGLNIHQVLEAGVPQQNIVRVDACTACNPKIFFSHRASRGKTGRQLSMVYLNP